MSIFVDTFAISQLLAASNRQISLVDWVSFDTLRLLQLKTVFAFDNDFQAQGFECVPSEAEN